MTLTKPRQRRTFPRKAPKAFITVSNWPATLGAPNYLTGDYNGDGYVNAADFTVWRDTIGTEGTEENHPAADGNHDFDVDSDDYMVWTTAFGQPASSTSSVSGVPEPTAISLLVTLLVAALATSKRNV